VSSPAFLAVGNASRGVSAYPEITLRSDEHEHAKRVLKSLEEPPPATAFFSSLRRRRFARDRAQPLPQTALPLPEPAQVLRWLKSRGVERPETVARPGGAPLPP